jgi:hypothetical protein
MSGKSFEERCHYYNVSPANLEKTAEAIEEKALHLEAEVRGLWELYCLAVAKDFFRR